jgi:hypothetical protein
MSETASSSEFAAVSDAVTLRSDFQSVTIPGVLKTGASIKINGELAIPISGTIPATTSTSAIRATLYVSKSSSVLPLESHLTSTTESFTANWTKWGHAVILAASKNARPLADPGT